MGAPVSARAIRSQIESRMRPTAKELIEQLRGQNGRAELMADYFEPIGVRCVADSYGFFDVPTETLRHWFHSLKSGAINTATNEDGSFANPAGFDAANQTRDEIREYLELRSKDDPEEPDSVIARWVKVDAPDGTPWTIDDILPSMLVVLLGGLQEPGHALGNTFLGLTTNPDQLKRVIADKSLVPKAIAEGLRWIAPLWAGPTRSAKHDMVVHGVPLKKGDTIRLVYGSANHDSNTFEHPELYDIDRDGRSEVVMVSNGTLETQYQDRGTLTARIRALRPSMSQTQAAVANVVLTNPAGVLHMTVSELARVSRSSVGSVVRFCQDLGLKGYQEFKLQLASEIPVGEESGVSHTETSGSIVSEVFQSTARAISEGEASIDPNEFQRAVSVLDKADRILLVARACLLIPLALIHR